MNTARSPPPSVKPPQMMLNHKKLTQPRITSRSLKSSSKLRLLVKAKERIKLRLKNLLYKASLKVSMSSELSLIPSSNYLNPFFKTADDHCVVVVTLRETMAASPPRQD
ncbi:hypothetical protein DY000_02001471 [Brassica cretica]|nr:hypothetical protein DY000_02001471 [Brassica cretica]